MPFKNVETDFFGEEVKIYQPELVNIYNSYIGAGTSIGAFVEIGGARIGRNCKIQAFVFICPGVEIENDVFIGPRVTFTNDKYPKAVGEWKQLNTLVKEGASIGAGAIILPGVTIGEYALIGAGSVVTKDVPPHQIWQGNPARPTNKSR